MLQDRIQGVGRGANRIGVLLGAARFYCLFYWHAASFDKLLYVNRVSIVSGPGHFFMGVFVLCLCMYS